MIVSTLSLDRRDTFPIQIVSRLYAQRCRKDTAENIFCRNGAVQMNLQTYVLTKPAESVNRERMCPGSVPAGFTVLLSFQVLRRKSVNASYSPFISPV